MIKSKRNYDVIVVGAGHAGCEAAILSSKLGCKVLLLTIDKSKLATLPCSPSIGGTAKGQLVKEIDALGGVMGIVADKSAIQYKTLNMKKGPAVRSTRTQNDKYVYKVLMKEMLEKQSNLYIKESIIDELIVENNVILGVIDSNGLHYLSKVVILAIGTFLGGIVYIGSKKIVSGRYGENISNKLFENIKKLGLKLGRMKTGTPPRVDKSTIDFSKFEKILFNVKSKPFSFSTMNVCIPQVYTYMGYTNSKVHNIVKSKLFLSSFYGGAISGIPARYCPSLEDKVVRFPNRDYHQLILEPEGLKSNEVYISGLGNSFPIEIQLSLLRSISGFYYSDIIYPAYAIEYSYINPIHLKINLESKIISNLYIAGQINGTSGYEEAAAQGVYAGINAACYVQKRKPFILDRSQAYIGVMVDDLVGGISEPYRLFTSRSEYRLSLREDNAIYRLSKIAYKRNIISKDRFKKILNRERIIREEINRVKTKIIKFSTLVNNYLSDKYAVSILSGLSLCKLLKRSELDYNLVRDLLPINKVVTNKIAFQLELILKYEGYIKKQAIEIKKFRNIEKIKLPYSLNYRAIDGLSNELKEKLIRIQPVSLGQVSRISGITPAGISVLIMYLRRR